MSGGRRNKRRWGGAVLETAVALPLLAVMSFGLIEYGHFFYMRHVLQGAAREGARAAIPAGVDDPDAAVSDAMTAAGLGSANYIVTTDPADISSASKGTLITVTVECNWGDVGLRPMKMISSGTKVTGAAVMRKE
jgi:Flp pilus assembly protein TadG